MWMSVAGRYAAMESDTLSRALIRTAVDGIILIDARGVVQVYNAACEALFGYSPDEVIGQSVGMLMPTAFRDLHARKIADYLETGEGKIIGIGREVTGRRQDGSEFPMYLSVGEGLSDGRKIFVGIVRDLTERKTAEDGLREREARLLSIFETVPDTIITFDEDGIVQAFSGAASRMFGYEPPEVVGQNFKMLTPRPAWPRYEASLERFRATGEQPNIGRGQTAICRHRNGTNFPVEFSIGEVFGGTKRQFTAIVRDITDRVATEQRLQELHAELAHVSRLSEMNQMTAGIAHELNQPLAAFVNYAKAAKRILDQESVMTDIIVRAQEMIDKAAGQALRAGDIIRNLRSFVEKRENIFVLEDLATVISDALDLALVGTADMDIDVNVEIDPELPAVVVNKIQIQQVLLNLIRNSIDALREVETRRLLVTARLGEPGYVDLTVRDNGPGLSPAIAARLFQPFQTTKAKGMGIGLTICQSIVESHGGRIWLLQDSEPGAGFRFRLPLATGMETGA
jgi:two-component system sensor kinase FixL